MNKTLPWMLCLALVPMALAEEGIIVNHPPNQSFAWPSDTDYLSNNLPFSRRIADDFILEAPATVRQVAWWGHYGGETPPVSETMRIRFYAPRADDGLPGDLLLELTVVDPHREATGLFVSGPAGTTSKYPEYLFKAGLSTPITLPSNEPYWLEIVQIGDRGSRFEWEFSTADQNGFAASFPSDAPWESKSFGEDMAFQLATIPEPAALMLLATGVGCARCVSSKHQEVLR